MVWIGIRVLARTNENVLLRTLDVRRIRRTVRGMRKAPGMESNGDGVYTLARAMSRSYYS